MKTFQARWIALLLVAAAALYLCWRMLEPFIQVLLWAVVLVIVFFPVHRRIEARLKSPGWSAVVSCLLVIVTILIPLTLVTLMVVREATGAVQYLQQNAASLLDPNSPVTGPLRRWLEQYVDLNQLLSPEKLTERVQAMSGQIANRTIGYVSGLLGLVVEVFFVIFTMYYLFRDGDRMRHALYDVLPLEKRRARQIFERTRDVISASVYGVLVIAVIQGILGGLAFWVLEIPSPLLWGVVMMFLSMIPMLGSFIVWVPAALYLAATGHYWKAALLAAWGGLVIGSVDNFLRPKLVGEKTRLHELLIFFSVLGGLQLFGVLGIVLGPVVVAVTLALLEVFRHIEREPEGASNDTAAPPADGDSLVEQQAELRNVSEERAESPA